jgi:hypothetical protein
MTIPGFSAYLMSSHGNGGCFLSYTDEYKKVAIQAQHSVTKIGKNEGGSGAFVCDFVVEDLRAAMQALNDFRGMVLDIENDKDGAATMTIDGDDDEHSTYFERYSHHPPRAGHLQHHFNLS